MYQWRWAPGDQIDSNPGDGLPPNWDIPGASRYNDNYSWNFNITAHGTSGEYSSEDLSDEFGVYKYIRVVSAGTLNPTGIGKPGQTIALSPDSMVNYSANLPYKLSVDIPDLASGGDTIPATYVSFIGGDLDNTTFKDKDTKEFLWGTSGETQIAQSPNTQFNGQRKIVRAGDGELFAVYIDSLSGNRPYLANSTDNGQTWYVQEIAPTNGAEYPALAIDSEGDLHVTYRLNTGWWSIQYQHNKEGVWCTPKQVDSGGPDCDAPCIALNSDDDVWIVYARNGDIMYNANQSGVWTTEQNLNPSDAWADANPSIGFDSGDILHAVWSRDNFGSYEIFYERSDNFMGAPSQQQWSSDTIYSEYPCIVLDNDDDIHIVYQFRDPNGGGPGITTRDIYYSNAPASSTALTSDGMNSTEPSLTVDSDNNLYCMYYKMDSETTHMRKRIGADWENEFTIHDSGWNRYPNLRWSKFNNPMVDGEWSNSIDFIYTRQEGAMFMKYGHLDPTDSGEALPDLYPSIVDMDATHGQATDTASQRSLVRNSTGVLFVAYPNNTFGSDDIHIAMSNDNGETWNRLTVAPDQGGQAIYPSMAVDQANNLHVTWEENLNIYYGIYTIGPGWGVINDIDGGFFSASKPSIAIDTNNFAHVTWVENNQIYYYNSTFGNQIFSPTFTPSDASIAFGTDGLIHVVWSGNNGGGQDFIYHTTRTPDWFGGSWGSENQITYWDNNWQPSIAIDSMNKIHLTWYNWTGGSNFVEYMQYNYAPAMPQTRGVGFYPAITIDDFDTVYIIYPDNNNDLWLEMYNQTLAQWDGPTMIVPDGGDNTNWYVTARWAQFWDYAYSSPVTGNVMDYCYHNGTGAPDYNVFYDQIPMWEAAGSGDTYEVWFQPNDYGYYANGTWVNQPLECQWWIEIPWGTPEGMYTGTITYTLYPWDQPMY
jgi:hypothetical protein